MGRPTIVEIEQRLTQLARSTWQGRGEWQGNEKVIVLPEDLRQVEAVRSGVFYPVPGNDTIEYQIAPKTWAYACSPEEEDDLQQRSSNAIPRHKSLTSLVMRKLASVEQIWHIIEPSVLEPVTFTCQCCKQTVTQAASSWPKAMLLL